MAYSEYHQLRATTYRILPGDPPPPPVFLRSTVIHNQTVYTQGLDVLGQVTGTRISRGPTGRRSDARKAKAALSPELATRHGIIIGSDVSQHVERYPQP